MKTSKNQLTSQCFLESAECGENEEKTTKQQSARCVLISKDLYQRGYIGPLLKCIPKDQVEYIMKEIHEGICGSHSGV